MADYQYKYLNPIGEALGPDEPLWRYMKLSTLVMLLQWQKVFIPTLAGLRRSDKFEATRLSEQTRATFENLSPDEKTWLRARAKGYQRNQVGEQIPAAHENRVLQAIWLREIALRRLVWCWYAADIESMAMWHIYGREGVAIRTTARRIDECLFNQFGAEGRGIISRIGYYPLPTEESWRLLRPYLVKEGCYRHECEVRVVLSRIGDDYPELGRKVHDPTQAAYVAEMNEYEQDDDKGGLIEMNGSELIDEIRMSPFMPPGESYAIADLIKPLVRQSVKVLPSPYAYDRDWSEEAEKSHRGKVRKTTTPQLTSSLPEVMKTV